jgi:hypothetical protein
MLHSHAHSLMLRLKVYSPPHCETSFAPKIDSAFHPSSKK